jgi:hypothetical protein
LAVPAISILVASPDLFNSDAATAYQDTDTAFETPDGRWTDDNPATLIGGSERLESRDRHHAAQVRPLHRAVRLLIGRGETHSP